jgi:hypothetical protein
MGMARGGLTTLPIPDNMFDEQQYGGGGIVAFSGKEGSDVKLTDEMLIKVIQDPRAPAEERAAALQELQERRGPVSDYGTPRTAEDTRAAFAEGLPQGLAQVGGALGQGFMNSEFAQDMSTIPAGIKDYLNSDSAARLTHRAATAITAPVKGYMDASRWMLGMPAPTPDAAAAPAAPGAAPATTTANAFAPVPVIETTAAPSRAPLNAPTKEGYLGDAGPNIRNDRVLADTLAKNAAAPVSPDAAEKAAAEKAAAPKGLRVDAVDAEVAKAVADVAKAAPEKDYAAHYADAMAARDGYPTLPAGESIADQKKQDFNMALAQMGFGIAAGTSPYALTNIGAGAAGAVPGMQKAMDRRRESQRDAEKADFARQVAVQAQQVAARTEALGLVKADEERKLNRAKLAQDAAEGLLDRESRLEGARITSRSAGRLTPLEAAIAGGKGSAAYTNYVALNDDTKNAGPTRYEQGKDMLDYVNDKLKLHLNFDRMSPEKQKQLEDMYKEEYLKGVGSLAAAPAGGTSLVDKYAPRGG